MLICHIDLSLIALIGIILLIGIVKKNAIMMIDFALEAERNEGLPPEKSIYQACLLRFRPIMMTTWPRCSARCRSRCENGTGSELRRPLGISIVGGLLLSQFLTLYTTPGHLSLPGPLGRWVRRMAAPGQAERPGLPLEHRRLPGDRNSPSAQEPIRVSMNISEPFIRRPVGTSLLAGGILILGPWLTISCRWRRCRTSISR